MTAAEVAQRASDRGWSTASPRRRRVTIRTGSGGSPLAADVIPWDGPQVRVLRHDGHEAYHGGLFLPNSGVLVAA